MDSLQNSEVVVRVALDPTRIVETGRDHGKSFDMRAESLEIVYFLTTLVPYWKVRFSVATGTALHPQGGTSYRWNFGQVDKPLWVAALELKYYPREIWNTSPRAGH